MSYNSMLKHRIDVYRISVTDVDGVPETKWHRVLSGVRAFVDLNFIRRGKDPIWTQEAGRPQDRTGVLFLDGLTDVRSGDRLIVIKGPEGSFQVEGAVDEAWRPENHHHTEVGIVEVSKQLQQGWAGQGGPIVPVATPRETEERWRPGRSVLTARARRKDRWG